MGSFVMRPATLLALGFLFLGFPIDASAQGHEPVTDPAAVFSDQILVQLFTVKIRALDHLGAPLPGLDVEDLRVRVGRKEVPIVAVDWIPAGPSTVMESVDEGPLAANAASIEPRLVIFFVQTSVLAHRAVGLRWLLRRIDLVLDSLHPSDRVAVASFHHHLEFRSDFTRNRDRVVAALEEAVHREPSRWQPAAGASLASLFDQQRAVDAGFVENGLEVVADALAQLPGEKIMFFVGWGLGEEHGGRPTHNFFSAAAALYRAEVTVSSLAVGNLMDGTTVSAGRRALGIAYVGHSRKISNRRGYWLLGRKAEEHLEQLEAV